MKIVWETANGSQIKAISHDEVEEILYIKFAGGGIYAYENIDKDFYQDFREADSLGSYFHANIRKIKTTKLR